MMCINKSNPLLNIVYLLESYKYLINCNLIMRHLCAWHNPSFVCIHLYFSPLESTFIYFYHQNKMEERWEFHHIVAHNNDIVLFLLERYYHYKEIIIPIKLYLVTSCDVSPDIQSLIKIRYSHPWVTSNKI